MLWRTLDQSKCLIYGLHVEKCLARLLSRNTCEHASSHRDHTLAIANMTSVRILKSLRTGCVHQCLPLSMTQRSTTCCAHCFKDLDQRLVGKTHCAAELGNELDVPEDLRSYFVIIACAFERSQHAGRLRYWWQLQVLLRIPEDGNSSVSLTWARVVVSTEAVLRFACVGCAQRRCMIKLSLQL